jgi:hypothetical protein
MVSFQTKNTNLGKFWRATDWKMLIYIMAIWNILQTLEKFYDNLVHFVFIWYIFAGFGIVYQEKSGNPGMLPSRYGHTYVVCPGTSQSFVKFVASLSSYFTYLHTYTRKCCGTGLPDDMFLIPKISIWVNFGGP